MNAGGPYTITGHLMNDSIQLNDVLFGDVWVCSGQSNMHFPLTQVCMIFIHIQRFVLVCFLLHSYGYIIPYLISFSQDKI